MAIHLIDACAPGVAPEEAARHLRDALGRAGRQVTETRALPLTVRVALGFTRRSAADSRLMDALPPGWFVTT